MRAFKTKLEQGLVDANLGGHVYKKRVALLCLTCWLTLRFTGFQRNA
jgi:hypothetical protein